MNRRANTMSLSTMRDILKNEYEKALQAQEKSYISGISSILTLNKDVMEDIITKANPETIHAKLKGEGVILSAVLAEMKHVVEEAEYKLMISNKIIKEYISDEEGAYKECSTKSSSLRELLDKKEYQLQMAETKFNQVERLLMKYSQQDNEINDRLKDFDISITDDLIISNAVVENNNLKHALKKLSKQNKKMRKHNEKLSQENFTLERNIGRVKLISQKETSPKASKSEERHRSSYKIKNSFYSSGMSFEKKNSFDKSVMKKSIIRDYSINASKIIPRKFDSFSFAEISAVKFN